MIGTDLFPTFAEIADARVPADLDGLLEVAREHKPDAIGLSGLLVKSTVVMRENLEEMNRRGVDTPVILGGAALTRKYVEHDLRKVYDGALWYAQDAFEGL